MSSRRFRRSRAERVAPKPEIAGQPRRPVRAARTLAQRFIFRDVSMAQPLWRRIAEAVRLFPGSAALVLIVVIARVWLWVGPQPHPGLLFCP